MSDLCDDQVIHDNIYANTYSLWGNSKYYDIKNLSPQNFANRNGTIGSEISQEYKALRWMAGQVVEPKVVEPPDRLNRRTVDRDSLYDDPETFKKSTDPPSEDSPVSKSPSFDWTQFYWHKATEVCPNGGQGSSKDRKRTVLGPNNVQKKIDKMLAKPVKMSKAESMMQKMGWDGGALGRSGDGIVEPIAPNAVYVGNNAKTKIGFGQSHIQTRLPSPIRSPKHSKKAECKNFYEMNVLLNIFEFVKNNSEVELLFDKNLRKDERKRIHHLVQFKLSADDMASVDFDSPAQMELVLQISDKNCYILHTQSYGSYPIRQLSLFKVAPPHVYLITPDKLKKHRDSLFSDEFRKQFLDKNGEEFLEVEVEEEPPVPEETKSPEEIEPEEETNPFLRSITRNLKKKSDSECQEEKIVPEEKEPPEVLPEMSEVTAKIVKYFNEFVESKKHSQFKFLGPFTEEELVTINEFMAEAVKYVSGEETPFACVFKKVAFEINEDCTGNTVIYKRPIEKKYPRKN
ncbi:hypothetical protein PYW08_011281 [Mythimna loreyi]|uniref:Uncharacterized protein n=1 Tax=Mythimna loreyi TaxID=667449 RepID=A0ACC2Q5K7_9NEOP|nr:hypothetical protein PYW08_011281 [Mythimna loreyi]